MLPKKQRLTGKEVLFLTKKKQYLGYGLFGFFYTKQYAHLKYHQFSCHITIKLSKKAVTRHLIKRAIIQYIEQHKVPYHSIGGIFYKFFIVISKNAFLDLQKKIANLSKKDTITYIQKEFERSWMWISKGIGEKGKNNN